MLLLDTNVVIVILNDRPTVIRQRLTEAFDAGETIAISTVVIFELRYGAELSAHATRNHTRIEDLLSGPLETLHFNSGDAAAAGAIRAQFAKDGNPTGPFDVLIAGQARARDMPIVTANTREFQRVPGLEVQNWEMT